MMQDKNDECNCDRDSNGTLRCPVCSVINEQEQKTFDSEPISSEEFNKIKDNLYDDDLRGGLHNIQVPPEDLLKIKEQEELAKKHIIIKEGMEITEMPQKTDGVITVFTPEELIILREILETYSLNMRSIGYAYDVMNMENRYDHQSLVRQLRDTVDMNIDNYVKLRPYNPFFVSWAKKIGKKRI